MAIKYQVRLHDSAGVLLAVFDEWDLITYNKKVNYLGDWIYRIDADDTRKDLFALDGFFMVYRRDQAISLAWTLDFGGFVRRFARAVQPDGSELFEAAGFDFKHLLARRVVIPDSGDEFDVQSSVADTAMYEIVKDNAGSGAIAARDFVTEAIAAATASSIAIESRQENLLDTCIRISEMAQQAGTGVDFDVYLSGTDTFNFKTYVPQLGLDKTWGNGSNDPVIFSTEHDNMNEPQYVDDRSEEKNFIYVLGAGDGATREITEVEDSGASDDSPFNRIEAVVQAQNATGAGATDEGDMAIRRNRRKRCLVFQPLETPATRYTRDWVLGDLVTARYDDLDFSVKIGAVTVTVDAQGGETLGVVTRNV